MGVFAFLALILLGGIAYAFFSALRGREQRMGRLEEVEQQVQKMGREIEGLRAAISRLHTELQTSKVAPLAPSPVTEKPAAAAPPEPVQPTPDPPSGPLRPVPPTPKPISVSVPRPVVPLKFPTPQPASVSASVEASKEDRRSLEERVGANWLNRIGITLLVFGVAFFLAYQLTHIGPLGKVVAGIVIAATLLVGGLWLERKPRYTIFARAGIGGGWALFFLTTYAAHYFDATRVLSSEIVDLILLFFIGAGMVVHSLRYRSQVVTGLAFLLAFSTVTLSQNTIYSLLASAVLALGLEIVCLREEWFVLELAGIAAAYGNHFLWLDKTLTQYGGPHHPFDLFWPSTLVLLLFYLIFRVGYVLRKPTTEEKESLSGVSAFLNAAAILLTMKYQSFHPELAFRALMLFGVIEFVFAFVARARKRQAAFAILSTLASVMVVAAVPLRYRNATWPFLWLLEAEALWLTGVFLRERILRILGATATTFSLVALTILHADLFIGQPVPDAYRTGAIYLFAAALLWMNAEWISPRLKLEESDIENPLYPTSSIIAAACTTVALWIFTPSFGTLYTWLLLGLALTGIGIWFKRLVFRLEGYGVLAVALLRLFILHFPEEQRHLFGIDERIIAGAAAIVACVALSEVLRRSSSEIVEKEIISGTLATAATTILSTLFYLELSEEWLAAGWSVLLLLGIAIELYARDGVRQRAQSMLLAGLIFVRILAINFQKEEWRRLPLWIALALFFATVPLAFQLRKKEIKTSFPILRRPEQLLFFLPLAVVVFLLGEEVSHTWLTLAWSLLGVTVFLLALAVGERSFRFAGVGLLLFGVAKLVCFDVWQLEPTARYLSLIGVGIALLGVSFLYSRYAERIKAYL